MPNQIEAAVCAVIQDTLVPGAAAACIASTIFLLGNAVIEPDTRIWTLGIFGVILAGMPFYWFVAKRRETA